MSRSTNIKHMDETPECRSRRALTLSQGYPAQLGKEASA